MENPHHKAGFVNILGKPNVGKSTLMNNLVGERLAIITAKAQTTRHRIMGIVNQPDYQIVFSDTPGIINPHYKMQEAMMRFVKISLTDADVILFVVETGNSATDVEDALKLLKKSKAPVI
ncbi:MAG TPA: 50S ribosome-binding GTPase, partial [Chitinophagales bacterium]|nr:50S ribosome-binding GTPase [Chitinophagales bacterium]